MTDTLPTGGTRTRDQTILLNRLGREFLKGLNSSLRTVAFHDSKNQIFNEPIGLLIRSGNGIIEKEGFAEFIAVNDQFFLNQLWIKPTITERNTLYALADLLKTHGLGGLTVRAHTTDRHWRAFLEIFRGIRSESQTRAAEINRLLAEAQIEELEAHHVLNLAKETPKDLPFPPQAYSAVVGYAKCLLVLKQFTQSAPGDEQVMALRKAQRVICELVDFSDRYPRLFGLLSLFKDFDSYFVHHSVNVMILSLVVGRCVGMGRKELVDLGMAALFFDVGKMAIPDSILRKKEALTAEERTLIEQHPLESAAIFLTLGYLNESVAERILVAYQHHWAAGAPHAYPRPRREIKPSLMAEIVALCDRYDAISSDKVYRRGLSPKNALRVMAAEGELGYSRKPLLNHFLRAFGPLPPGTWLEFGDGEEGLVVAGGLLSTQPPLPVLFVPGDAARGTPSRFLDPREHDGFRRMRLVPKDPGPQKFHETLALVLRNVGDSLLLAPAESLYADQATST